MPQRQADVFRHPRRMTLRSALLALVLPLVLGVGCDDGHVDDDGHHDGESPSGAECPDGSALTWETFGQTFMTNYCTRCHATTVAANMRNGAPSDHNFDKVELVREMIEHIDSEAAAGPDAVNTEMPIGSPAPTEDERRQLGEWLACGAP
jgi:hypothetical protein